MGWVDNSLFFLIMNFFTWLIIFLFNFYFIFILEFIVFLVSVSVLILSFGILALLRVFRSDILLLISPWLNLLFFTHKVCITYIVFGQCWRKLYDRSVYIFASICSKYLTTWLSWVNESSWLGGEHWFTLCLSIISIQPKSWVWLELFLWSIHVWAILILSCRKINCLNPQYSWILYAPFEIQILREAWSHTFHIRIIYLVSYFWVLLWQIKLAVRICP